jgi:hypothetical protein
VKKLIFLVVACGTVLVLSSCSTTLPFCATSNAVGSKVGESTRSVVLGALVFGDAGISTAAKNGGIKNISTVDVKFTNLWFLQKYLTTVTGE